MSALPPGWVLTTMGEICDIVSGSTPRTSDPKNWGGRIPWITPDDLSGYTMKFIAGGKRSLTERGYQSCSAQLVPAGTVLYTSRAPIGYVAIASEPVSTNQGFKSFVPPDGVMGDFLYWYLRYATPEIRKMGSGTTFLEISKKRAESIPVLIAPTAEQRRIVAAIEGHFSRIDAGVEALRRARRNLQRMRAAVLEAIVTGRLVPQDSNDESAEVLLNRILKERCLGHGIARLSEPTPVGGNLHDIPAGWRWATVDQLAAPENHAITDGPFGSNLKTSHYTDWGPRVIRLQNIGAGIFIDESAHISPEHYEKLRKHAVSEGDLIIAALGNDLPRACVVPKGVTPAIVKADCIRFRPHPALNFMYLNLALNAPPTKARVSSIIHGVGRPRLNLKEIKGVTLPLPPALEQERIAAEASRHFSIIEAIDNQISTMLDRSTQLRRAALATAFDGDLVPQEPSDEPAAVLLERIKAAQTANSSKQHGPRRSRR